MKSKYVLAPYIVDGGFDTLRVADVTRMTHLYYAFAVIKDGKVVSSHLKNIDKLYLLKNINPDLKIILSIGGWSAGGFSEAAFTQEGRQLFAETACDIIKKYNLDGLDIDWEYPSNDQAGIAAHPNDKQNFTLLLKELRQHLNTISSDKLLTIAVGSGEYYIEGTEMSEVVKYLDYVNLMTYDMRGGFTEYTGHHANLYYQNGVDDGPSAIRTIRIFNEAGVPIEKMILGAAFYGRCWKSVDSKTDGIASKAETVGKFTYDYPVLVADFINKNQFKKYWDDCAKAPYLFNGKDFISYEDEKSLEYKCEYVKQNNLAGIMFWEYSIDVTYNLFNAIYSKITE